MSKVGFTPGGRNLDVTDTANFGQEMGQFAQYPGSTPKYVINKGPRDAEYRETMARMFIEMPQQERDLFVTSCPPETRPLARALCGVDTGGSGGTGFIDFLLTNISEPFNEKIQVVETLSDNFVIYTFGQQAPQFQYSGILYNTYQDDQRVWMLRLYRDIIRATQLARRRKLIRLRYDSVIVTGVAVMHTQNLTGDAQNWVNFNLVLIPTEYTIFTPAIGNPTKLKEPATEGGKLGVDGTGVPDTKQKSTTAKAPEPSVWDKLKNTFVASRKRANELSQMPFPARPTVKPKDTASSVLLDRMKQEGGPNIIDDLFGGILPSSESRAPSFPSSEALLQAASPRGELTEA